MRCAGGGYIDVPCVDGAVLVNLGALMQRWTADVYKATVSVCVCGGVGGWLGVGVVCVLQLSRLF